MKHIVWTRIDGRLIRGQVMTQWTQYAEVNKVLIIDDGVAKDPFLQMVMKFSAPSKISLKVLSVKDVIGYLNRGGKHEKIIILVETPVVLDELNDIDIYLKSINTGGTGAKAGKKPIFKSISVSEEEKKAFHSLLNKGINVFLCAIVIEPEEDIARYLQKENDMPMRIRSNQAIYRR